MSREHDIKAPDGFLLGGLRKVRKGGLVLFGRDYWKAPLEWAGERIWVHWETYSSTTGVEAAPPGVHIYDACLRRTQIRLEEADRPSAKPGLRTAVNKAWHARTSPKETPHDQ